MNHLDVSLFFAEPRLTALQKYLDEEGATVSEKLAEHFMHLYEQYVPEEERFKIEADIAQEDAKEKAEAEARKRFGVFHIRVNVKVEGHRDSAEFQFLIISAKCFDVLDFGKD